MNDQYLAQHKKRLSYMPWLYYSRKPKHKQWASRWQADVQARLASLETITFGEACFIAPEANLFAEPGRDIVIGSRSHIAADVFMHGPIELGEGCSINRGCTLDGGRAGIRIGHRTRIASDAHLFAFNHGMAPERNIADQPVTSTGITIGEDVWIGAGAGIVDGVSIGDKAIVGMKAVVTRSVPAGAKVAGNPARIIGWRVLPDS